MDTNYQELPKDYQKRDGKNDKRVAITALVLSAISVISILNYLIAVPSSIISIVLSVMALKRKTKYKRMAIGSIVCSTITALISMLILLIIMSHVVRRI